MNPLIRLTFAIALAVTAIGPASAKTTGAPADGSTRVKVERLTAGWILPIKGGAFEYVVVSASRTTDLDTDVVALSAGAGVGECFETSDAFGCEADLRPYKVVKFDVAVDYRSATVVLRRGRVRNRVNWSAGAPYPWTPPVGSTPEPCPGGKEGTLTRLYLLSQNATAEGRVLGRNVSTAGEYDEQRAAEDIHLSIDQKDCP